MTGLPGHVLACSAMFSAPGFKAHKQLFGLFDIHYMNHRSQVLFPFNPLDVFLESVIENFIYFFGFLRQGFLCIALAVLELTL